MKRFIASIVKKVEKDPATRTFAQFGLNLVLSKKTVKG